MGKALWVLAMCGQVEGKFLRTVCVPASASRSPSHDGERERPTTSLKSLK